MSHAITNLISQIQQTGIQDRTKYSGLIEHIKTGTKFNMDPYVIDVTFPGSKYLFYNNAYWKGNQEFKQPVAIRYEDQLLITAIMPEFLNPSINLMFFLNLTSIQANSGSSVSYKPQANGNLDGSDFKLKSPSSAEYKITIQALDRESNNGLNAKYVYYPCFLERILPMTLSSLEPGYQTVQASFVISGGPL